MNGFWPPRIVFISCFYHPNTLLSIDNIYIDVRDGNLPIPNGYPQKIPIMGRVKTRILGMGVGMGNYP
jgi:hypothetical protein